MIKLTNILSEIFTNNEKIEEIISLLEKTGAIEITINEKQ